MGELLLLLRLEGPLQSWGTRARWDVRDTGLEPTKSGVVGLLGCATGLPRGSHELEEMDRALRFGVRVDRPGIISVDYQTVSGYHRTAAGDFRCANNYTVRTLTQALHHGESTIVSPRDYLHDARFLVALGSDDEAILRKLAGEVPHPEWRGDVRRPAWPLYLGRKSCVPTRPVFCRLTEEYGDVEDALRHETWAPPQVLSRLPYALDAWIEDLAGDHERQDALRVGPGRFYGFRRCSHLSIPIASLLRRDL